MGVPQGSNLGPLLFILFANDLLRDFPEATVISFADDTSLVLSHKSLTILTANASAFSSMVFNWMQENGLVLNSKKTRCMLFGGGSPDFAFQIHHPSCPRSDNCQCDRIESVPSHKFLGLHIDTDMRFDTHVNRVCGNLRAGIAVLARIRSSCDLRTRSSVFHALIGSHVNYMLPIYGSTTANRLEKIAALQRRAIKTALSLPRRTPSIDIYDRLHTLPLNDLRSLRTVMLLYPMLHTLPRPPHSLNTRGRSAGHLHPPRHRLASTKNSPVSCFIAIYNGLPVAIRSLLENQHVLRDDFIKRSLRSYFCSRFL